MTSGASRPDGGSRLTIGTLAAATGIPPETIRTWERRYGFPVAERKPSGHRVYPLSVVPRLRRVAQVIARGHRPAEVVHATDATLDALLAAIPPAPVPPVVPRSDVPPGDPSFLTDLLDATRRFDTEHLRHAFQADWARLGPLGFLEGRAAPFIVAVGSAWEAGTMDVRHEHCASNCLGDFLRAARLPLEDRAGGPVAVLATLPGELHGIGLQMAAVVFALHGWRPLVLGVDTPGGQIVALAREVPIGAVALSLVRRRPARTVTPDIARLRRSLPRGVPVLVGGSGLPRAPGRAPGTLAGAQRVPDLAALDRWVRGRA